MMLTLIWTWSSWNSEDLLVSCRAVFLFPAFMKEKDNSHDRHVCFLCDDNLSKIRRKHHRYKKQPLFFFTWRMWTHWTKMILTLTLTVDAREHFQIRFHKNCLSWILHNSNGVVKSRLGITKKIFNIFISHYLDEVEILDDVDTDDDVDTELDVDTLKLNNAISLSSNYV